MKGLPRAALAPSLLLLVGVWCGLLFIQEHVLHWHWVQQPLSTKSIARDNGLAFKARLTKQQKPAAWGLRQATLLEDGRASFTLTNSVDAVRTAGKGLCRVKDNGLWFAPPDGSSPFTNGRVYALKIPWAPSAKLWRASAICLALAAAASLFGRSSRNVVRHCVSYTWGYFFGAVASTLGGRFAALDGLRAIAFLMVMVAHGTRMDAATPVDSWFHALGSAGWCGVDLFFALSGFLITGILLRSKASHHYYRDYYLRRILRIFPLYFGFLLIYCELLPATGIMPVPTDYEKWSWAYWCCVANLAIAANGGWATSTLAVFWTLAVEEQFYLVWPAIVKRLGVVALAGLCCAVALAALIWRWHLSLQLSEPVVPIYVSTLTRVDSLAFGALAAVVFAWAQRSNSGPWLRRVAGWITTVGASLLIIAGHMRGKFHFSDPFVHTIGFTLLAVTFSALVLHVALKQEGQWLPRLLTQRWLVSVGRYSYAMYVTHMVVLVHWLLPQNPPKQWPTWLGSQIPAQLAMYVICLIAVYSIARLSWLLIESHFMRIRKH